MCSRPDISIIIISTNERHHLQPCLESIQNAQQGLDVEVFVIDNGSSDGTSDLINTVFPSCILIRNPHKLGFSTNNNIGLLRSRGIYNLILNPDTMIAKDTLTTMKLFMDKNLDVGAAACKLVNPDGTIQYTCRQFPGIPEVILRWAKLGKYLPRFNNIRRYLMMDWDHSSVMDVEWIIGAFLMVRRSVLEIVGPFDQRYDPLYIEDMDLCYRIRSRGFRVVYVPLTTVIHQYHRESARSVFNRMTYYHVRNFFRFYTKFRRYRA